jgi:hypothetical protein
VFVKDVDLQARLNRDESWIWLNQPKTDADSRQNLDNGCMIYQAMLTTNLWSIGRSYSHSLLFSTLIKMRPLVAGLPLPLPLEWNGLFCWFKLIECVGVGWRQRLQWTVNFDVVRFLWFLHVTSRDLTFSLFYCSDFTKLHLCTASLLLLYS